LSLGIVASFFDDKPRGIGKSSGFLIRELSKLEGDFEILSPLIPEGANVEKFRKIPLFLAPARGRWGNIRRFFWQNFKLAGRYKYLFSTSYESSLLYFGNQGLIIHDVINLRFREFRYPPLVNYYYRFQNPFILKLGAKVVVPSNFVKWEVMDIYKVKEEDVGVVYWGVDRQVYKPVKSPEVLKKFQLEDMGYILYVGDLMRRKNITLIIRALPMIKGLDFVIAGTVFDKVKFEILDLAEKLGVRDRVKFLGYVSEDDLKVLYSHCYVFVYPSLMEGFGMPPLEAASCGAPVIVSDIPVFRELYSGYFVFVDPNDPEDLAVKIEKIERKDYSELFRKFSWENSAKTLYGLLKNWGFL
jgi:glycosyltransferase involved in cell wall biosynthesis